MEVLTVVSPFLQFVAQNADTPVLGARGVPGYGGLQGFSHIRVFFSLTGRSLAFQSQRVVSRFHAGQDSLQRADEQLVDLPVLGGDPHGFIPYPGTAAGSMSFSHYSFSIKCGGRQEFECGGASALELIHVGVSAAVHRGLFMTLTTLSVRVPVGPGSIPILLVAGRSGRVPAGQGHMAAPVGYRSVAEVVKAVVVISCTSRSSSFFLFMFLGGPPYSVQFQSTGRSSCMLLGTVMVVDVLVNRSDKLRQFIFVVGANCAEKSPSFHKPTAGKANQRTTTETRQSKRRNTGL